MDAAAATAGPNAITSSGPRNAASTVAATSWRRKDTPKIFGMLPCAARSSVMPEALIQALPNSGPYQSPPSRNVDTAATTTAIQLIAIVSPSSKVGASPSGHALASGSDDDPPEREQHRT